MHRGFPLGETVVRLEARHPDRLTATYTAHGVSHWAPPQVFWWLIIRFTRVLSRESLCQTPLTHMPRRIDRRRFLQVSVGAALASAALDDRPTRHPCPGRAQSTAAQVVR